MRNGSLRFVLEPSSNNVEIPINLDLVDDDINEADEGYILLIEIEGTTSDNITLVREGVALIVVADDDRTFLYM